MRLGAKLGVGGLLATSAAALVAVGVAPSAPGRAQQQQPAPPGAQQAAGRAQQQPAGQGAQQAGPPVSPEAQSRCQGLTAAGLFANTTINSARMIPADPKAGLPAFCEVGGTISPEPGSQIGVVFRLPEDWNGKLLGLGGGGWAGNVTLPGASEGLTRGYATAQTDAGHASTEPWNTSWTVTADGAINRPAIADFSHRAIHLTAVTGKEVVRRFYGKPHQRAYYQGCSTGGRMGLMEAQRYPEDYDGIISAAPVYSFRTQLTGIMRGRLFEKTQLSAPQVQRIHSEVLRACDALDGAEDGMVAQPDQCRWDPGELQCKAGESGECLTPAQVQLVRTIYEGQRTKSGQVVMDPLPRGSEYQWLGPFLDARGAPDRIATAMPGMGILLFGDPKREVAKLDPERDLKRIEANPIAQEYQADDPDISRFVQRGGKLILWHGMDDPGPGATATVDYYRQLVETLGGKVSGGASGVAEHARLFLLPGVGHCRGGIGPDRIDALGALEAWVEKGVPPAAMTASRDDNMWTRPVCPYPAVARYSGRGNPRDAANYSCG